MVNCAYRLFNYMVGIQMIPGLRSRLARFGLEKVLYMPYGRLKEELPGETFRKNFRLTQGDSRGTGNGVLENFRTLYCLDVKSNILKSKR